MQLFAMTHKNNLNLDQYGHCDCSANSVHVAGRPVSMFMCSCENCQRVGGAGHSAVVLFHAEDVRTRGALKSISRPAASGASFTRHFCPECGTTLLAQSSRAPALRIVPVGIFAGANDWFKPNQLIFSRSHQAWDLIADHLPRHDTYRKDEA
ncbi:GFA family protein [Devosia sp. Leaf420]|uniref:GFA family protein n=1 Tax=Devosia sp. Leaf420 TaxID=1736374 RepID=UPI0009EA0309